MMRKAGKITLEELYEMKALKEQAARLALANFVEVSDQAGQLVTGG
jgi:hypothetical protein